MDIFPDWLGQTGGAGTPYPVLVQGLELALHVDELALTIDDTELGLAVVVQDPRLTIEPTETVSVVVNEYDLDLEVDGA
jgi:hypothetical protein